MNKFDEMMREYSKELLDEQHPDPASAANTGAAAGPVDPAQMPAEPVPEEPEIDPEEVVNQLEKGSKKPWVDLAGVLARAMEFKWTDEDVNRINNSLPGGLTLRDFVDTRTSPNIRDKYDSNIVSAAIMLFDYVDKKMSDNDVKEVVPAEQR